MYILCKICGEKVKTQPSRPRKCCSRKCAFKLHSQVMKGRPSHMKGKKHSLETIEKLRRNNNSPRGKKSHLWRGGMIKKGCVLCKALFEVKQSRKNKAKYCSSKCYWKWMEDNTTGKNNNSFKGGKRINYHGYITIYSPGHPHKDCQGYVLEHRLIMEKKLRRFLEPREVVHHI